MRVHLEPQSPRFGANVDEGQSRLGCCRNREQHGDIVAALGILCYKHAYFAEATAFGLPVWPPSKRTSRASRGSDPDQ